MSILVVGTVALDSIATPFDQVDRIEGGSALHFSYAATQFYKDIQLVSVVGDDFPKSTLQDLESRGVDISGVQVKTGEKSFYWSGEYHMDMNSRDTLVTELNVLADFDPVLPEHYKNADYLMLGNLTPAVQMKVIDQLPTRPKLVMMDTMNFWMDSAMDELKQVIAKVDVITINDEEARQLSNEYSIVKGAKKIMEMGPRYVIIKKGEHGALIFYEDQIFYSPALPLEEVFDPTGAGDSFAGGLFGFLAKTGDLSFGNMKRAVIYGSATASFCVEKFGAKRLQEVNSKDIHERLGAFVRLMQFDMDLTRMW